jgi:hypothetical protein
MTVKLALYRGPSGRITSLLSVQHILVHWAICLRTLSRHSHAELCIDGICYSASEREKGVRSKVINIETSRWDVFDLRNADANECRAWFEEHKGQSYDWMGILGFILPVKHDKDKWFCFEAVGAMLGIPRPHRLNASKLLKYANGIKVYI